MNFPESVYDSWQEITLDRFSVEAGAQTLDPVRFPVKAGTSPRAPPRESER